MKIIKPLSSKKINDAFLYSKEQRDLGRITFDQSFSLDSRFQVGYLLEKTYGSIEYDFFIFCENKCIALVQFEQENYLRSVWNINKRNLLMPHATIDEEYRGNGFASFFYTLALKAGFTLVGIKHTVAASQLWERVAFNNKATILHHSIVTGKIVDKQYHHTVKLLSL